MGKYKVFISQPMNGLSEDEIKAKRTEAEQSLTSSYVGDDPSDLEFIDSYLETNIPEDSNDALWYLGESLKKLSEADVAYFSDGWKDARGCSIEHQCAEAYGIPILDFSEPEEDSSVGEEAAASDD